MKTSNIIISGIILCTTIILSEEYTPEQEQELGQKALHKMLQKFYTEAMEAKRAYLELQSRDIGIEHFSTTAPRTEFIVNADISTELQAGIENATVYVSTDNQTTWQSATASLLGMTGYESTWGGTISTGNGNSAYSYISGLVNSEALGYDYGTMIVSGTPHNINGNWPPGNNLYASMVDEPSGDASSNQDITALRGTYKGEEIERVYLSITINGGCCDEGGLFGPWYLYGVGIVNPESNASDGNSGTAYAIGYGDGGFGQLTPGLLKISGDLATGEIEGFEYLTTNISYSTSGNDMQATALMNYIINDSDWGTWPNSINGFIVLGVTVEASLSGLDVEAEVKDQTNPGLMICTTNSQEGNIALALSSPQFDSETNTLSIMYSDGDSNLPWLKKVIISNTDNMFYEFDMIPNSHTYEDGVTFYSTISGVADGSYDALFHFADDDIENYPNPQISLPIIVGGGSEDCALEGDLNSDDITNVLDVVLLVNLVLASDVQPDACSDINGDGLLNVLDVVLLVNIVLGG